MGDAALHLNLFEPPERRLVLLQTAIPSVHITGLLGQFEIRIPQLEIVLFFGSAAQRPDH
jgi:hypothetical protein